MSMQCLCIVSVLGCSSLMGNKPAVLGLNLLNRDDEGKSLLSWALSCPEILRLLEEAQCRNNRAPLQLQAAPIRLQGGLPEVQVIMDVLSFSLSGQYSGRDPMLCPQWKTTP